MSLTDKSRRSKAYATGTKQFSDGGVTNPTYFNDDVLQSAGRYQYLTVTQNSVEGSRITGFEEDGIGTNVFDYPSAFYDQLSYWVPGIPALEDLATATLANANPNSNDMSLPNSLFELRELPSLIKQSGEIALDFIKKSVSRRTWASANLAIQFGYSPMVQDARILANVAKATNSRLQTMQNLRKYGRINKKKRLGVFKDIRSDYTVLESNKTYLDTYVNTNLMAEVWGISEWILDPIAGSPLFDNHSDAVDEFVDKLGFPISHDQFNAFRAAYGLYQYDVSDLWNILPWSWCIDYFANVGDLLDANNNSLGLRPTQLAICIKYTANRSHPESISWTGNSRCSPGKSTVVAKTRQAASITSARQNFRLFQRLITPNQAGILASLFILKKNKRTPNPYMSWADKLVASLNR